MGEKTGGDEKKQDHAPNPGRDLGHYPTGASGRILWVPDEIS
jgi:hypothetical protein